MSSVSQAQQYAYHVYAENNMLDVYDHSEAVVHKLGDYGTVHQMVAYLHDVVEDTPVMLNEIHTRFGPVVTAAVDAMTRREGENYWQEYIPRLECNPIARVVKYFDAEHNYSRPRVYGWSDERVASMKLKYDNVMRRLRWW